MKVIKGDINTVVMKIGDREKRTPCCWLASCRAELLEDFDSCNDCPAELSSTKLTYAEAIKWWEEQ